MLRIEIVDGADGADVSIEGVDFPEAPEDEAAFAEWDARQTSIRNAIHALLGELGPIPEAGWDVKFWCSEQPRSELEIMGNLGKTAAAMCELGEFRTLSDMYRFALLGRATHETST